MRALLPDPAPGPVEGLPALARLYADAPAEHVRGGMVLSADGATSAGGVSAPLSSPADKLAFRTLRAVCDAVLVGAGTARAEDYGPVSYGAEAAAWRADHGLSPTPPVVVVTNSGDLDPGARLFTGPTVVLTCEGAAPERRAALAQVADVLVCGGDRVDLAAALPVLRARGLGRLLCEGGPSLLGDLAAAGLLTELCPDARAGPGGSGSRAAQGGAARRAGAAAGVGARGGRCAAAAVRRRMSA